MAIVSIAKGRSLVSPAANSYKRMRSAGLPTGDIVTAHLAACKDTGPVPRTCRTVPSNLSPPTAHSEPTTYTWIQRESITLRRFHEVITLYTIITPGKLGKYG